MVHGMKNVTIAKSIRHAVETDSPLFGRGGIKLPAADTSGEVLDLHRRIKADLIIIELKHNVVTIIDEARQLGNIITQSAVTAKKRN
jgi:hypothetical protein